MQRPVPDISDPVSCKQPCIARPGDGMIGYFRDAVGIAQTARPQSGQDLLEPMRLEADQVKLETAEFEIPQLTTEQIGVQLRCLTSGATFLKTLF